MHLFSSWDRYYFYHPHSKFWGLEIGHSQASVRVTEMTRVGHNFNLGLSGFQVLLLRFPPKGTDAAGRHLPHLQSSKSFCEGPGGRGAPLELRQGTGLSRPPCRAIEFPAPGVRPMLNFLDLATWEGVCPEPCRHHRAREEAPQPDSWWKRHAAFQFFQDRGWPLPGTAWGSDITSPFFPFGVSDARYGQARRRRGPTAAGLPLLMLLGMEARLDNKEKLVSSRSGEVTTLESSANFQMGAEREAREGQAREL